VKCTKVFHELIASSVCVCVFTLHRLCVYVCLQLVMSSGLSKLYLSLATIQICKYAHNSKVVKVW